ncbi:MAG TPA: hypothetical protein VN203_17835 [Candidatus Acidoferrum sp.]|nr:hypothetical protein [Candidatus Acidoferrum sp.]
MELWILFLVLVALSALAVRVVPEHHRFAVFVGGRFTGLRGPGILVRMPVPAVKWLRLRIGDRVDVVSKNLAKVGDFHFPVIVESGDAGTVMRIKVFRESSIVIGAE